ncbi:hypothetical protein HA51_09320 [Pantoea rwandensis]|uniref:Uncharacterized protein n=1 Tax=Pantoea rwandensis TaxID=1076550 RepID=A0A1X1CZ80_9GAMM|nr:hypothetical protein HA51_09320 [Pantoea rwandensis]
MRIICTVKNFTNIDGEYRHHPSEAGVNTNQWCIPLQAQFSSTLLIAEKSAIMVILQAERLKSFRLLHR